MTRATNGCSGSTGTAWANRKDLDAYLKRIEEAKSARSSAPWPGFGSVLASSDRAGIAVLPSQGHGHLQPADPVYPRLYSRYGYSEVVTPLIYKTDLWKTSGHYDAFRDDMFLMEVHDGEYGVKPMNCPGHCYLFASRKYSYRDLPIRFADFSRLHRFEPSGRIVRFDAGAFIRSGRCAYLLHAGAA